MYLYIVASLKAKLYCIKYNSVHDDDAEQTSPQCYVFMKNVHTYISTNISMYVFIIIYTYYIHMYAQI